jgi:hypothetical protein
MLIKSKYNKRINLPKELREFAYGGGGDILPLTVGKTYIVSAMQKNKYGLFYSNLEESAIKTFIKYYNQYASDAGINYVDNMENL